RETDTMDTFMCSSWYQYRYVSPHYDQGPFDPQVGRYWLPVDQYTGGVEHATMHLLYTRFFTKAMRDIGLASFDEPMLRLFNQGMILGEDGEKMSKSRGNVIAPDDVVGQYDADAVRAYLMFIGPWEEGGPWNSQGIEGIQRFLNRVWALITDEGPAPTAKPAAAEVRALRRATHQTIQKVTADMDAFQFNTMLAAMMAFNNTLVKAKETALYGTEAWQEAARALVLMLAPVCPHIAEELWATMGGPYSVHRQAWPVWDPEAAKEESLTLVVQVNGKVRDKVEVSPQVTEEEAKAAALATEGAGRHTAGKQIVKVIYAPGKLVNIVVR
ncbi:MAG: class I tRNA ligase family protein, partial [Chloroflexi bacterium]|nr:class I tRNA ligase family protein [Chloroflexota bacterium]